MAEKEHKVIHSVNKSIAEFAERIPFLGRAYNRLVVGYGNLLDRVGRAIGFDLQTDQSRAAFLEYKTAIEATEARKAATKTEPLLLVDEKTGATIDKVSPDEYHALMTRLKDGGQNKKWVEAVRAGEKAASEALERA